MERPINWLGVLYVNDGKLIEIIANSDRHAASEAPRSPPKLA